MVYIFLKNVAFDSLKLITIFVSYLFLHHTNYFMEKCITHWITDDS